MNISVSELIVRYLERLGIDYGEARRLVRGWLEARGVLTAGRAGAWEYSSMEDAILAGRDAAERLV